MRLSLSDFQLRGRHVDIPSPRALQGATVHRNLHRDITHPRRINGTTRRAGEGKHRRRPGQITRVLVFSPLSLFYPGEISRANTGSNGREKRGKNGRRGSLTFVMPEMRSSAARLLEVRVAWVRPGGPSRMAGSQEQSQDSCENSCSDQQQHGIR